MSFFGCRFVLVRVIGWDTWLDQKKTAKQWFRETLPFGNS
jgi:hypothetical protein